VEQKEKKKTRTYNTVLGKTERAVAAEVLVI